jgi:hypothetical protein
LSSSTGATTEPPVVATFRSLTLETLLVDCLDAAATHLAEVEARIAIAQRIKDVKGVGKDNQKQRQRSKLVPAG